MGKDTMEFTQKCLKCQQFAEAIMSHPEKLTSVVCAWPFVKWALDLIGPLPMAQLQFRYCFVAIDYLTKWVEVEPLAQQNQGKVYKFSVEEHHMPIWDPLHHGHGQREIV